MTNLVQLDHSLSKSFDWNNVDILDQAKGKEIVDEYMNIHLQLKDQATQLIKTNTLQLARTCYRLKLETTHGSFCKIAEGCLRLKKARRVALTFIGAELAKGTTPDNVLEMYSQMDPQAVALLMQADDESKDKFLEQYGDTQKVPSQAAVRRSIKSFKETQAASVESKSPSKRTFVETDSKSPSKRTFDSERPHASELYKQTEILMQRFKSQLTDAERSELVALAALLKNYGFGR